MKDDPNQKLHKANKPILTLFEYIKTNRPHVNSKLNVCNFKIHVVLFQSYIRVISKLNLYNVGLKKFEEISQIQNLKKFLVYGGKESQIRSSGKLLSWKDFG